MNVQDFVNFGEEALSPSFEGDIYKPPATDLSGYYTKVQIDTQMGAKAPIASPSFTGTVATTGEFRTTSQDFLRVVAGNFGLLGRMDSSDFYILMTASGNQYGSWNGLRPLAINMTTGFVTLAQTTVNGKVTASGGLWKGIYEAVYGDSGYYNVNINGQAAAAQTLRRDGTNQGPQMTFFWNGQAGQPSWLWGGNDGASMYVYNPSNFSVAYAANAGAIAGVPVGSLVQFTVSSNPDEVNYPVGQILIVWNNASIRPRNEAQTLRVYSGDTQDWCLSTLGTGAILAGTWRAKGVCSNDRQAFQRVS
jgi:hypothetical protein